MIIQKNLKLYFPVFKGVKVGVNCLFSEGLTPTTGDVEKVNICRNILLTENNDWGITALKNNNLKPFIDGQPLFS